MCGLKVFLGGKDMKKITSIRPIQACVMASACALFASRDATAAKSGAAIVDTGSAYQVTLVRTEAQNFYNHLNLKETWIPGEGGGNAIARGFGDSSGTFGYVCSNQGEGRSRCVFRIAKVSNSPDVAVEVSDQAIVARASNADTIAAMYEAMGVEAAVHGGYLLKTLASDSLDVSLSCVVGHAPGADQAFCTLQMLR